jgi:hypothetical protein
LVCLLLFAAIALAQQDDQDLPPVEKQATQPAEDTLLPRITLALQAVTAPDASALASALHVSNATPGAPPNTLSALGDLDGDGVPEMLLKWAMPDVTAGVEVPPALDSPPLWGVYLLSWDGTRWEASRLLSGVEEFTSEVIDLGPPVGRALALVIHEGEGGALYPAIFQVKQHAATVVWDAQGDDSRYEPLSQGQVTFQARGDSPAEMIVSGRADPGFLEVDPHGGRGFEVRVVYHWNGKAFVPAKTDYSANQDYTVYRFISALHLHDYRSAYALVVPAKFLKADAPTLDAFRLFVQDNWPELLQDEVFEAPEPPVASPDEHLFVLLKPDRRYVYHPVFSTDGKFLLTDLTRTQEATEP